MNERVCMVLGGGGSLFLILIYFLPSDKNLISFKISLKDTILVFLFFRLRTFPSFPTPLPPPHLPPSAIPQPVSAGVAPNLRAEAHHNHTRGAGDDVYSGTSPWPCVEPLGLVPGGRGGGWMGAKGIPGWRRVTCTRGKGSNAGREADAREWTHDVSRQRFAGIEPHRQKCVSFIRALRSLSRRSPEWGGRSMVSEEKKLKISRRTAEGSQKTRVHR